VGGVTVPSVRMYIRTVNRPIEVFKILIPPSSIPANIANR
jgi:hypothetical protein